MGPGSVGRLVSGPHEGWWVTVVPSVGGFSVQITKYPDFYGEGFDEWVETFEQLESFFARPDWKVEWESEDKQQT